MASLIKKLLNISDWIAVSPEDIETSQQEFMGLVGPDFEWSGVITSSQLAIPTVRHREASIVFNIVPGGRDLLGLSEAEYNAVRSLAMADESLLTALMPATDLEVQPFLMSQCPILKSLVTQVIRPERALFRPDFRLAGDETNF